MIRKTYGLLIIMNLILIGVKCRWGLSSLGNEDDLYTFSALKTFKLVL
jgi:hypothetical protein